MVVLSDDHLDDDDDDCSVHFHSGLQQNNLGKLLSWRHKIFFRKSGEKEEAGIRKCIKRSRGMNLYKKAIGERP